MIFNQQKICQSTHSYQFQMDYRLKYERQKFEKQNFKILLRKFKRLYKFIEELFKKMKKHKKHKEN